MTNNNKDKSLKELGKEAVPVAPLEIPITHNKTNFGKIIIKFEENDKLRKFEEIFLKSLINDEILQIANYLLKKDMEYIINAELIPKHPHINLKMIAGFYLSPLKLKFFRDDLFYSDERVFELIVKEGPIALRNSIVQRKINEWLSNEEIRSEKINKLRDSLLEYSLGNSFKETLLKLGRPKIDVIRKYGIDWIKEFYQDIRLTLKNVKRESGYLEPKGIDELVDQAFREVNDSKKADLEKKRDSHFEKSMMQRLNHAFNLYIYHIEMGIPNPIATMIKNDKSLKDEFDKFDWQPNLLATKILAKFLDVSVSKITKILYNRKT